ncbi:OTU domain-containing protein [Legionella israelensis]|uniref:Uncharacterized protein n=1 Tax=Legionella israelensis TaxID=454 RepID=A0A0W0W8V4_9GAMM|nr:OTU domain-containing protein [Legionella israelensis]KTD28762.1 hypothetical protein Lisr_0904 [Legionella israelensis]QBS09424.1 hypothetical protein E4T55_05865 [Legionella israelensis]SCX87809.1 hypothetical protein SAMN02746069_00518 [Legionella israelensis DSM 19235]STX60326.1 Uncharacterised protein [Legionella israelensis]
MSNSNAQTLQTFFGSRLKSAHSKTKTNYGSFIDVGDVNDSGFRAMAAAIVDGFYTSSRRFDPVLKRFLSQYYLYYPEFKLRGLMTVTDHMNFLCETNNLGVGKPELLNTMAFVLRQMAVDEMLKHPDLYRDAFIEAKKGKSSLQDMRLPGTPIHKVCMAALASVLDVPVQLSVKEAHKELPSRLQYNKKAEVSGKPLVQIQLNGQYYFPKLKNPERFKSVTQRQARKVNPRELEKQDPSITEVTEKIAENEQGILNLYEDTQKRLEALVVDGELSKKDLLDLYISIMSYSEDSEIPVKVGLEHGNQAFIDTIQTRWQRLPAEENQSVEKALPKDHQDLIDALARAVGVGQISQEKLFAAVEEHISPTPHRASI